MYPGFASRGTTSGERCTVFRFFGIFLVVQVVLFGIEMLNPVQQAVVHPWTGWLAKASAAIVHLIDPTVISYGRVLQSLSLIHI